MEKLLLFPGRTDRGIFTYVIDNELPYLVKTASEYHPEIANYINSAKKILGKTQILLTALGAGEVWGSNINGDFFPESGLSHFGEDYGYKTFEYSAKMYKHHINKDPTAAYGDVALSVYNPKYHRVELILVLDNAKAPDIAERMDNGDYPEWSMGCKVPFDVCSICGNKAPTRAHYCEHLKYYMGRIHPGTGKMAYAINYTPKFFDISQVLIGADKIAKTLKKVASINMKQSVSSALLAEKMAGKKVAEIEKEIPSSPPASQDAVDTLAKAIPEVKAQEKPLPKELVDQLASNDIKKVFSTMVMMGIIPKPQEFQRILLISIGKKDVADHLDSHNMCFDPMMVPDPYPIHEKILGLSADKFDPSIMSALAPHVPDRSYALPHLARRIVIMIKRGNQENLPTFIKIGKDEDKRKPFGILPLMMLAAGLYAALSKNAPKEVVGKLDMVIAKYPALVAALAATPMIFNMVAGPHMKGQFDQATPVNPDVNNILARVEEQKAKPFLKISGLLGPASRRLFVGIPAVYMASGILQKHREANPYEQEGRIKSWIRKYPDLIGSALAFDAMMSLFGRGSYGVIKHLAPAAKSFFQKGSDFAAKAFPGSPVTKTASAQDFVTNALIWPLAFGGKGIPGRVVGGLFDQAILEGSRNVVSKKSGENKITDKRS